MSVYVLLYSNSVSKLVSKIQQGMPTSNAAEVLDCKSSTCDGDKKHVGPSFLFNGQTGAFDQPVDFLSDQEYVLLRFPDRGSANAWISDAAAISGDDGNSVLSGVKSISATF